MQRPRLQPAPFAPVPRRAWLRCTHPGGVPWPRPGLLPHAGVSSPPGGTTQREYLPQRLTPELRAQVAVEEADRLVPAIAAGVGVERAAVGQGEPVAGAA